MKTKTVLLFFVMICVVPAASYGQLGNVLRNKASKVLNAGSRTLNKEADNKIDSAAQGEIDNQQQKAAENSEQTKTGAGQNDADQGDKKPARGLNLGGLMGGKVTARYDESYSFSHRIYMQMELYDKKDVTRMDDYIYFTDANSNAGFEMKVIGSAENGDQTSILTSSVFDAANKVFLILTDMGTMKMGIISEVPEESAVQDQAPEKTLKPSITKTGKSKVIAGYKCDEYLYRDPESKEHGNIWVTRDLKFKTDSRTFAKAGLPAYYGDPDLEGGVILAMETYDDKDVLKMKSETKEINMNYDHTISVAGYSLRQINFNQAGTQNKK